MFAQLILAMAFTVVFHLLSMALCARAAGIAVRDITFGVGPRSFTIGVFHVALLPIGGNVRLATLADLSDGEQASIAFDTQPGWKRILLPLSGCLALLGLGTVLLGANAVDRFHDGFAQWLGGAMSPIDRAQVMLQAMTDRLPQLDLTVLVGLAACKLAALNLLPYPNSNGLQAILGVLPPRLPATERITRALSLVTLPLLILLYGGWLLALVFFLSNAGESIIAAH